MKISNVILKVIGVVLAVVGLALLLAAVGLQLLGAHFEPVWAELILGACFIALGAWLVNGGQITL